MQVHEKKVFVFLIRTAWRGAARLGSTGGPPSAESLKILLLSRSDCTIRTAVFYSRMEIQQTTLSEQILQSFLFSSLSFTINEIIPMTNIELMHLHLSIKEIVHMLGILLSTLSIRITEPMKKLNQILNTIKVFTLNLKV